MTGSNLKPRNSTRDHLNCDVRKVVETVRSLVGLRKSGHGFHRYDVGRCCRRGSHPLWHSPRLAWPVAWGLGRAVRATEFIRQIPALVMKATPAVERRPPFNFFRL